MTNPFNGPNNMVLTNDEMFFFICNMFIHDPLYHDFSLKAHSERTVRAGNLITSSRQSCGPDRVNSIFTDGQDGVGMSVQKGGEGDMEVEPGEGHHMTLRSGRKKYFVQLDIMPTEIKKFSENLKISTKCYQSDIKTILGCSDVEVDDNYLLAIEEIISNYYPNVTMYDIIFDIILNKVGFYNIDEEHGDYLSNIMAWENGGKSPLSDKYNEYLFEIALKNIREIIQIINKIMGDYKVAHLLTYDDIEDFDQIPSRFYFMFDSTALKLIEKLIMEQEVAEARAQEAAEAEEEAVEAAEAEAAEEAAEEAAAEAAAEEAGEAEEAGRPLEDMDEGGLGGGYIQNGGAKKFDLVDLGKQNQDFINYCLNCVHHSVYTPLDVWWKGLYNDPAIQTPSSTGISAIYVAGMTKNRLSNADQTLNKAFMNYCKDNSIRLGFGNVVPSQTTTTAIRTAATREASFKDAKQRKFSKAAKAPITTAFNVASEAVAKTTSADIVTALNLGPLSDASFVYINNASVPIYNKYKLGSGTYCIPSVIDGMPHFPDYKNATDEGHSYNREFGNMDITIKTENAVPNVGVLYRVRVVAINPSGDNGKGAMQNLSITDVTNGHPINVEIHAYLQIGREVLINVGNWNTPNSTPSPAIHWHWSEKKDNEKAKKAWYKNGKDGPLTDEANVDVNKWTTPIVGDSAGKTPKDYSITNGIARANRRFQKSGTPAAQKELVEIKKPGSPANKRAGAPPDWKSLTSPNPLDAGLCLTNIVKHTTGIFNKDGQKTDAKGKTNSAADEKIYANYVYKFLKGEANLSLTEVVPAQTTPTDISWNNWAGLPPLVRRSVRGGSPTAYADWVLKSARICRRQIVEETFVKGLGDFLQEVLGWAPKRGYVSQREGVCSDVKYDIRTAITTDSQPLTVIQLNNDTPSGMRAMFFNSLKKDRAGTEGGHWEDRGYKSICGYLANIKPYGYRVFIREAESPQNGGGGKSKKTRKKRRKKYSTIRKKQHKTRKSRRRIKKRRRHTTRN